MSKRSLLLEIGCEELPSSALKTLGEDLHRLVCNKLAELGLSHGNSYWYAAPRRLAVQIDELVEQGPDEKREALGPPLAQAKDDDGSWTRAAEGFAARQGLKPEDLQILDTPKGQRLGVEQVLPGAVTREALPKLVQECIQELPVAKRMRWGSSRLEFARPIHWLTLLFGEESDFGTVLGIAMGRTSRGHRFHAPDTISIPSADSYTQTLRDAHVVVDFAQRRETIRAQVQKAAEDQGATAVIDEALLDEVTSLVEWPVALLGGFDEDFLTVPAEALISSMQSHQKYFPVVDGNGKLLNHFITVSNIDSRDPGQVIAGNERVIRPRLADAAFFFKQDLGHSLESRVGKLDAVVYQKQLGSLGDRARRIERLAAQLANPLGADADIAARAGLLCKADLVSEMVLEFADLQGIAGAHYARHDGEADALASAIEEHYWPLQAGSPLPKEAVATAVALADRLDTLVGIFGIGQAPSGSRDPFALRRASIAVLRIMVEKDLPLDLRDCLELARGGFASIALDEAVVDTVLAYLLDRLPAFYEDQQVPVETVRAVRATGCTQPRDFHQRVLAVQEFRGQEEAEALAAANKRVGNILAKAKDFHDNIEVSDNLLQETQEKELFKVLSRVDQENKTDLDAGRYSEALLRLAALREPVDAFFDEVMVNVEDLSVRNNRLALLAKLRQQFLAVADISQLAG